MSLILRRLDRASAEDVLALQKVLESAPGYSERISGTRETPKSQARENLDALPPGKTYDDKFFLGIEVGGALAGCVDLIRGYPDAETAWLGLLLIAEAAQGNGLGRAAYHKLEALARGWGVKRIRLAVVSTNAMAKVFWEKMGFSDTGETRPYECGEIRAVNHILEKRLLDRAP